MLHIIRAVKKFYINIVNSLKMNRNLVWSWKMFDMSDWCFVILY